MNKTYKRISEAFDEEILKHSWAVVKENGTFAGSPCLSYDEARDLAAQHEGSKIFFLDYEPDKIIEEAFDKAGGPFWYFTKHGVQPGSVPKGITIEEIKDTPEGTFFASDKVLTTDELKQFEIIEKKPEEEEEIEKVSIFESLDDSDIKKLSEYNLNDDELSHLLSLLELIDDDNKLTAFELVDAIFAGKKLVDDEEAEVSEQITYTRRLLGDK